MGLIDPLIATVIAVAVLIFLLQRRVNLGIALNVTALFLALLAVDLTRIPAVVFSTSVDPPTVAVILSTFGIMLLSQLYKETGVIDKLSQSVGRLIDNPRTVICVLPAVIGLLPVGGGALMSAPLVDAEADKLNLPTSKKAYVNLWFRHTILPLYPFSPVIITAALLTGANMFSIIFRMVPVAMIMIIVGYIVGFRGSPKIDNGKEPSKKADRYSDVKDLLVSFSPILTTIIIVIAIRLTGLDRLVASFDVVVSIFFGIIVMLTISRPSFATFKKPFKTWGIYGIIVAAYGAFLLRNVMIDAGISDVLSSFVANGSVDIVVFLAIIPAALGVLTGSSSGGIAVSVAILSRILGLPFAVNAAALVYASAFLGYTIAPTHLCLTFTADYFKCSLGKMYKYVLVSFAVTFPIALLIYFLF